MINFPPSDSAGAHSVVSGSCSLPKLCPEGQAVINIKFKTIRDDLRSGQVRSGEGVKTSVTSVDTLVSANIKLQFCPQTFCNA